MTFPYDRYASVEQMRADRNWPKYAEFRSSLKQFNVGGDVKKKVQDAMMLLHERLQLSLNELKQLFSLTDITQFHDDWMTFNFDFTKPIENLFSVCPLTYAHSMIKFNDLKRSKDIENMMDYLVYYNEGWFPNYSS